MFTRVDVGTTPPQKLDQFTDFMRQGVVPQLRRMNGYRSTVISIDRTKGAVSVATDWDSPDDRDGCDATLVAVLRNAAVST